MTGHEVLKSQEMLCPGARRSVPAQSIWLLQVCMGQAVDLKLSWGDGQASWEAPGGWRGLLLLDQIDVCVVAGQLRLRPLKLEVLSKLLAFVDEAQGHKSSNISMSPWAVLPLDSSSRLWVRKSCEYWFLQQFLEAPSDFSPLLTLLRHNESYWLVRFLLAQSKFHNTLQDLGQLYGVSYSHFRRLCRQALGSGAKAGLNDWRMARSLLDVVEGGESLTQVALKHGYASSSHFSSEIRRRIGASPRELSNIIRLASK